MSITNEDILAIASGVWASFLEDETAVRVVLGQQVKSENSMVSRVHISGAWDGDVVVISSEAFARNWTMQVMAMGEEELEDEDIIDSCRELANMIGGNVKGILPGPTVLSLPEASMNGKLQPLAGPLASVGFDWSGEPLQVSVFQTPDTEG